MGRPGSFVSYGPQWAQAGAAPFSRFKTYTREGGIVAQMITAGPMVGSADTLAARTSR
jgi:arylsulfatase